MKLKGLSQSPLLLAETRRRFRAHKTLVEAKAPLTGAYYWYPKPLSIKEPDRTQFEWDLMTFYDQDYADTLHESVWKEVLQALAVSWDLDYVQLRLRLRYDYTALPRGRVSQGLGAAGEDFIPEWNVLHGNDTPLKKGMVGVLNAFNLTALHQKGKVRLVVDEHEHQLPDDVAKFKQLTGIEI